MAVSLAVHPDRLELVQSLTLVLKLPGQAPAFGSPPPAAGWSLSQAFGAQLAGACPLARTSRVYVQLPGGEAEGAAALQPPPAASALLQAAGEQQGQQQQSLHSYELPAGRLDISMAAAQGQQGQQGQQQPLLQVSSYTTGSGNLHGGMVLELTRQPAAQGQAAASAASAAAAANATLPLCIHQVVPWYVRVWLHTLQLQLDGRPADLDALVTARRVVPAQDRRQQLELELCLQLPAATQQLLLTADFSKAFLTVFECPPDTHRGHDVPAATVTYPDATVSEPRALVCRGGAGEAACAALAASPLLGRLLAPRAQQQCSQGLLVPLAAPDFSMPYNVGAPPCCTCASAAASAAAAVCLILCSSAAAALAHEALRGSCRLRRSTAAHRPDPPSRLPTPQVCCLTSTVLAVYIGATLNALMRRHGEKAGGGGKAEARRKALKFVVVVALFSGLALYLDEALREQAQGLLRELGLEL
jgi:phosphatidylinositol glycan class T